MHNDEIKKYIAELLNQGISLSDIQKKLQSEKGVRMTFLELRLTASEIKNVDWVRQEKKEAPEILNKPDVLENNEPYEEDEIIESDNDTMPNNTTVVEISRLTRPGTVANGSVSFASGAKANWMIDQFGRLGLDKTTGEPTPQDIKEFQIELQKMLSH